MERTIKVLLLDDLQEAEDQILAELRTADIPALCKRVRDRDTFLQELESFSPDIVIADYMLEEVDGLTAMDLVRERHPFLPFIFVSWVIHEESVIETLQKGATDYVFKHQLSRLPLSVHRALRESQERKELDLAHERLLKSEEHFRSLIENASDIIMVLDEEGRIGYASPSARRLLGYTPEEMVGKTIEDFTHPEDFFNVGFIYSGETHRSETSVQFRFHTKSGDWRYLEAFWKTVLGEAGGPRAIVNSRDITDRRQEQEALKESIIRHLKMQTELQKTQQKVIEQERLGALGQMASGIAHDFSNALTPVLGFSEILLNHPQLQQDTQKLPYYLKMINTSSQDAMNIVGRLREFYRRKDKTESLTAIDLNKVIDDVVLLTQPKWRDEMLAKGVTITVEKNPTPVPTIIGNETSLREMFTNLIFNAVDALSAGGTMRFATSRDGDSVVCEISDNGHGMAEEIRKHCFEPFFSTKGKGGTGLGLSVVYGIIRRHEGTIEVKSEPQKGAVFTIRLPQRTHLARDQQGAEPSRAQRLERSLSVLIVDDEPLVRQVVTDYLQGDGHRVESSSNGNDALEKFKKGHFDLVVTDRAMPEMNGDLFAEKIKEISPSTPVIMLTGFGELMKAKGEKPAAVDTILSKPATLNAFREAIAKTFGSAK